MLYERRSPRSVSELVTRIQEAAIAHRLAVVGIVAVRQGTRGEGVPDDDTCILLELCRPAQAPGGARYGQTIPGLLPLRISVSSENGLTAVGLIRPIVLCTFPDPNNTRWTPEDVEGTLTGLIDTACDAVRLRVA
jgi:uncharacterized protein (DUF302 family)